MEIHGGVIRVVLRSSRQSNLSQILVSVIRIFLQQHKNSCNLFKAKKKHSYPCEQEFFLLEKSRLRACVSS